MSLYFSSLQQSFIMVLRNESMELNDPLIQSIIIYMYRNPGGIDLREMVCEDQYDEVKDCLIRNGMIREV